jgi:hypothetical protein
MICRHTKLTSDFILLALWLPLPLYFVVLSRHTYSNLIPGAVGPLTTCCVT